MIRCSLVLSGDSSEPDVDGADEDGLDDGSVEVHEFKTDPEKMNVQKVEHAQTHLEEHHNIYTLYFL